MKKSILAAVLSLLCAAVSAQARPPAVPTDPAAAQTRAEAGETAVAQERLMLAISSIDYPVTPGDRYRLTYRESSGLIQQREFMVDAVYSVDMGVFGRTSAAGMTFVELKKQVEEMIARNYTYSLPSFTIVAPGVFQVAVRDGASRIVYQTAWGMTRLSEIVAGTAMRNFSMRTIERVTQTGRSERFDLLRAALSDQAEADPFVKTGDTVILHDAERIVEITGEVRRPGRYELLDGDTIRDLIEAYAGGLTNRADTDRVRIDRVADGGERSEYVALPAGYETVEDLADGDTVIVANRTTRRAFVWFEGAVSMPSASGDQPRTEIITAESPMRQNRNGRFAHAISYGKRLSDVLGEIRGYILPNADLSSAALSVPGAREAATIDLQPLLSGTDLSRDMALPDNSIIFIPEMSSSVSVSGAVFAPGMIPYRPGADAHYYISRAGGINPERNSKGRYLVFNQTGLRSKREDPVLPGDSIFVENNSFGYNLERTVTVWIPIISMLITLLTFGMTVTTF